MKKIVWKLDDEGRQLSIYDVDNDRSIELRQVVLLKKKWKHEDALKFISDNFLKR